MNEFDLQMYERELHAWQRRLERQPPGPLTSVLHEIADQLQTLREHPALFQDEWKTRASVLRRFASLRTMYDGYGRH
jgi:hypothetical protein